MAWAVLSQKFWVKSVLKPKHNHVFQRFKGNDNFIPVNDFTAKYLSLIYPSSGGTDCCQYVGPNFGIVMKHQIHPK